VVPPASKELILDGSESDEQRLDRLLSMALSMGHPGIDEEGVVIMKGFIKEGRFDHQHYIKLWTRRLEDMSVLISRNVYIPHV